MKSLCFPSYWPGRSRGRWRRRSRSRQSHFHTPSPEFLRAYHTVGYWDTITWCHATPRLSHSWETQITAQVFTHIHKMSVIPAQQWALSLVDYLWRTVRSRITWRAGSRPGKRSESCYGDLWLYLRSAQCFQTPEAAGESRSCLWKQSSKLWSCDTLCENKQLQRENSF